MNRVTALWLALAVALAAGGVAWLLERRRRWHLPVLLIGVALCAAIEAGRNWT